MTGFGAVAKSLEKLEKTSSRIEKTRIVKELFSNLSANEKPLLPYILNGKIWPAQEGKELGVSLNLLIRALEVATGVKNLGELYVKTGDVGKVAEEAVKKKKQVTFFRQPLTLERIYGTFEKIASVEGSGSQSRKLSLVKGLFLDAEPIEARYLARIIVGELRTGVADGIIRDALAEYYGVSPEKIDRMLMLTSDWREVVKKAEAGDFDAKVEVGRPVMAMLAHVAPSIEEALEEHARNIVEVKYDGARVQVHKRGDEVKIFSRRNEDVTNSLSEIVEAAKSIPGDFIVEGEAIAVDDEGKVLPFQYVLRRFRRKKDIEKEAKSIRLLLKVFDCLYRDGKEYVNEPLHGRRAGP